MKTIQEISNEIMVPTDEYARTESLRALVDILELPETICPENLKEFLMNYESRDTVQAALVGLALHKLIDGNDVAPFARMLLILDNQMEPALAKAVREAMAGWNILDLYEKVTDLALNADPGSADHHYGFLVLSGIDPDKL